MKGGETSHGFGRGLAGASALACALVLAACGGGQRQDAAEPSGNFPVQVTAAFPTAQHIASHSELVITVRNAGRHPVPDIAVTVCNVTCAWNAPPGQGTSSTSFANANGESFLAHSDIPAWVVDRPPDPVGCGYSCSSGGAGGASSTDANTWALGRLAPGASTTFRWAVTALNAGHHVLAWEVSAGLNGKARAVLAGSSAQPSGSFGVDISSAAAKTYVNNAGQIVPQN